jgi:hypothetical protein
LPDVRGWSSSNLKYMRFFAQHCPDGRIGQQPADQLPWFHIVTLLTQLGNTAEREWYAAQTVQHGWSRSTLALHIKNRLHERQGAAVTKFQTRLPAPDSALAHQTLKEILPRPLGSNSRGCGRYLRALSHATRQF